MGDISAFQFWVNNPDFRLFKEDALNPPSWCEESIRLVEWGNTLLDRLARDPAPGKIGYAKWKLLDRYCRLHFRTYPDHRAETNLDNHPCIHQALLEIWQRLEDIELQAAIPELEPPQRTVVPARGEVESAEEITGIIIGESSEEP